jgi:hypothetical protein
MCHPQLSYPPESLEKGVGNQVIDQFRPDADETVDRIIDYFALIVVILSAQKFRDISPTGVPKKPVTVTLPVNKLKQYLITKCKIKEVL